MIKIISQFKCLKINKFLLPHRCGLFTFSCSHENFKKIHEEGWKLYNDEKYSQALKKFNGFISEYEQGNQKEKQHQHSYATMLKNAGLVYYKINQYFEAFKVYNLSLDNFAALYGNQSKEVAECQNLIAEILLQNGHTENSLKISKEAQRIFKLCKVESGEQYLRTILNIGCSYIKLYNLEEAELKFREGLRICQETNDTKSENYFSFLINFGGILYVQGKSEQALNFQIKLLEEMREVKGPSNIQVAHVSNNIGATFQGLGNLEKALTYFESAFSIAQENKKNGLMDNVYHVSQRNVQRIKDSIK